MYYYAALSLKNFASRGLHFALGQRSYFNRYDVASGSDVSNAIAEKKAKQRDLESERDLVKDRMFGRHFSLLNEARKKRQTLSSLVGTPGYVIRAKFVTILLRYLFGLS